MSSWHEERRADKAADAARRRDDKAFEAQLRRDELRAKREDERNEKLQRRRDRAQRRRDRAARREKTLAPEMVYRRGTLALVAASALASLPAQIMHFVRVSLMLLPLPFALEGAAWVMAAGVAYADEKKLPAWVRWLLRGLSLSAAGFAAHINYSYGAETNASVGWGLAAVTMGGPLFFEVRQWVMTLSTAAVDPKKRAEEKARTAHAKQRRKDHKDVVTLAKQLVSAAPYGSLAFEDAFAAAWEIKKGTRAPGMTPDLHAELLASRKALADAMDAANGSPVSVRGRLMEVLHPAPVSRFADGAKLQVVSDLPPAPTPASERSRRRGRQAPPPHRRTKGDALPFHPLAKTEAARERRVVTAANGHHC